MNAEVGVLITIGIGLAITMGVIFYALMGWNKMEKQRNSWAYEEEK